MNNLQVIENVMVKGDLKALSDQQRVEYYAAVCDSIGLNPLTKPFEYITLNGKLTLYANKGATEQLRKIHGVSIKIVAREKIDEVYVVTAEASDKNGRIDSATGAVPVSGLKGDSLANAFMKAETKAKRRVTLSLCGLNMLDESEIDSIPQANAETPRRIASVEHVKPTQSQVENFETNSDFARETTTPPTPRYVVTFGKFKGKTLDQINTQELISYSDYIQNAAAQEGKPLKDYGLEFVKQVETYVNSQLK